MSRRTNKIASSQAETADLVSALSEAAGSSSSSAPIHMRRVELLQRFSRKKSFPILRRVRPAAQDCDFALSPQWRRIPIRPRAAAYSWLKMTYLRVISSRSRKSFRKRCCRGRGHAATEYTASEYGISEYGILLGRDRIQLRIRRRGKTCM